MPLDRAQLAELSRQQKAGEPLRLPPPAKKRKRDNREHRIQRSIVNWWAYSHNSFALPIELLHSVPNGGYRSATTGSIMKAEGQRKGVFDLKLNVARAGYHGLWLEVKTPDGFLTKEQKDFQSAVNLQGYCAMICRSFDEGIKILTAYLNSV